MKTKVNGVHAPRIVRHAAAAPHPGIGSLCAEAQADGVPCYESGRDCEKCDRAWKQLKSISQRLGKA